MLRKGKKKTYHDVGDQTQVLKINMIALTG